MRVGVGMELWRPYLLKRTGRQLPNYPSFLPLHDTRWLWKGFWMERDSSFAASLANQSSVQPPKRVNSLWEGRRVAEGGNGVQGKGLSRIVGLLLFPVLPGLGRSSEEKGTIPRPTRLHPFGTPSSSRFARRPVLFLECRRKRRGGEHLRQSVNQSVNQSANQSANQSNRGFKNRHSLSIPRWCFS